jgi:phage tail-like protein
MPISDTTKLGLVNRFFVTIVPGSYDLGSWSKVDGLDVSWDVPDYRAGDLGNHRYFFPGNTKYSSVRLARATCDDTNKVRDWLRKTSFEHEPGTATITLCDSTGKKITDWELENIMPVKWSVAGFEAGGSAVAVETLEFAHTGFLKDEKKIEG